jgi:putative ATP-binding cassette transporter
MVWFAVLYAALGTWLTHKIGRPLIGLEFDRQRFEADYRFSLVRLRENSEGVALYRGENEEMENFRGRFAGVITNWWSIMKKQKQLGFFTISYDQLAVIFPFLVAAPRYFSGAIQLGGLMQISSAFGQVQTALSWFIDAYSMFAQWKATVDRLTGFSASLAAVREEADQLDGDRVEGEDASLSVDGLALALPQGRSLLQPTSIQFTKNQNVLVSGPSGAGKSTLFRALAGIWPYWKGRIRLPKFAVCYPDDLSAHSDDEVRDVLRAVGLSPLDENLERSENWAQVLSGGEQQRLAFARALLIRPDWLFLDEATASLPEDAQDALYRLLKQKLKHTTLVSIGHRTSLAEHHERRLALRGEALAAV